VADVADVDADRNLVVVEPDSDDFAVHVFIGVEINDGPAYAGLAVLNAVADTEGMGFRHGPDSYGNPVQRMSDKLFVNTEIHMKNPALPLVRRSATKKAMARRKLFKKGVNLNLHLSADMVRQLDKLVDDGETRTDVLREAVRREIERRETARAKKE